MEQLLNALSAWFTALLAALGAMVGATIALFDAPARLIGMPAEVFATVLLCGVLLALWRAMGKYII